MYIHIHIRVYICSRLIRMDITIETVASFNDLLEEDVFQKKAKDVLTSAPLQKVFWFHEKALEYVYTLHTFSSLCIIPFLSTWHIQTQSTQDGIKKSERA